MTAKTPEGYKAALELAVNPDKNFMPLGRLLGKIKAEDPAAFRAWIKQAGMSRRKAYYLIKIAREFEDYPDQKRLEIIGWTKLKLIATVMNEGNLEGLMHLAETETVRALSRTIRGLEDQGKTRSVMLYFTPGQYAVVEKALLAHGAGKVGKALLEKEKALLSLAKASLKKS
jgi:hypothetical protein